jgi:D-glycero-alpha-D-manno-heptose 1-phosphate guanylyltransferase
LRQKVADAIACFLKVAAPNGWVNWMRVVILAGGLGTRLRSVLPMTPKCLALVAGQPFLFHLLNRFLTRSCSQLILSVYHLAGQVRATLGVEYEGIPVSYVEEEAPLGTGGALRLCAEYLAGQPFIALNADSFLDIKMDELVFPTEASWVNLAAVSVPDTSRYGALELGEANEVVAFREKTASAGGGLINAGIYCIRPEIWAEVPSQKMLSWERDILPRAVATRRVRAQAFHRDFIDIGTPESYSRAERILFPSANR